MKKRSRQIIISVLVAVVIFYFLFQKISISDVVELFRKSQWQWIALGLASYALSNLFRSWRFDFLLGGKLPRRRLYGIVSLLNFYNNVLPFRSGELSYVWLLRKTGQISGSENVASLVVSRFFDFFAVVLLLLLSIPLVLPKSQEIYTQITLISALVFLGLLLIFFLFFFRLRWLLSFVAMLRRGRLGQSAALKWFEGKLRQAKSVLEGWRSLRHFYVLSWHTLLVWGALFGMYFFLAMGLSLNLSFWQVIFAASFPTLVSAIPLPTFAGAGTYEGAWALGFTLLGGSEVLAISSSILVHLGTLLYASIAAAVGYFMYKRKLAPLSPSDAGY